MMRQTLLLWDATCSCDSRFVGRITTITLVGLADGLNSGAGTSHCPSDVAGRGRVHSRSSTVCNRSATWLCLPVRITEMYVKKKDIDGITLEYD